MAVTAGGIGLTFGVPAAAIAAATIVATAALHGGWREFLAANELRDS